MGCLVYPALILLLAVGCTQGTHDTAPPLKFTPRNSCPDGKKPTDYPVAEHWKNARRLMHLSPELSIGEEQYIEGIYTTFLGFTSSPHTKTTYMHMWKCGNDNIRSNMETSQLFFPFDKLDTFDCPIPHASRANSSELKCKSLHTPNTISIPGHLTWTVVRDPISHFISGYNEIEYRLSVNAWWHMKPFKKSGAEFLKHPVGSKQRFAAFVRDFLSLRISPKREGVWKHIFPMSGLLYHMTPDMVGDLHSLGDTWEAVQSRAGIPQPEFVPLKRELGRHNSSSDPFGTYAAARAVVSESENVRKALCWIVMVDYVCFGYPLPVGCDGAGTIESPNRMRVV